MENSRIHHHMTHLLITKPMTTQRCGNVNRQRTRTDRALLGARLLRRRMTRKGRALLGATLLRRRMTRKGRALLGATLLEESLPKHTPRSLYILREN
jgi:hypothetical protein